MNTNTPFFRGALTVAAIWIAIWGYLSISEFRSATERLNSSRFYPPDYLTDDCYSQKLEPSSDPWRWRDPTSEEVQSCLSTAQEIHARSTESSAAFEFERAWKGFSLKGLLPAAVLLILVAFWNAIIANARLAGTNYLNWLRFGSSSSSEKKDKE